VLLLTAPAGLNGIMAREEADVQLVDSTG